MSLLGNVANRFPKAKALAKAVLAPFRRSNVSAGYVELTAGEAGSESSRLRGAWQSSELPERQRELVDRTMAAFRRGEAVDVFDVLLTSLAELGLDGPATVLEIGCSSGYYSEVVARMPRLTYSGCDYSPAFIEMARQLYPDIAFGVEDACDLNYGVAAFDVVISGCCLLHIPDYRKAVAETARVARDFAIFHRTPMVIDQPERVFRKLAYGVETIEIHFAEPEFLALLAENGLDVMSTHTLSESVVHGAREAIRTYVCRKVER